jgi:dihydrofolate reductase
MMSKVILGFTMSLDGFINDKNGSVEALYSDLVDWRDSEIGKETIQNTGAALMGRKTFAMGNADDYADNYEFQVPIFVVTKTPPKKHPKESEKLKFIFVTDGVESAIKQAKQSAGDKDVIIVGGANIAVQAIQTGLVDEIHMDVMPILFGDGLRPFEMWNHQQIKLQKIQVIEMPVRTQIRFRINKDI